MHGRWPGIAQLEIQVAYPIVVIKLDVKESSENLRRRQLFPTPERASLNEGVAAVAACSWHKQELAVRRTAIPNQKELDEVIIVLPPCA